jgi:serine/threonine protein kinase/Tfp pilus assembly protein PilF
MNPRNPTSSNCLSDRQVEAFAAGRGDDGRTWTEDGLAVARHLESCAECRQRVEAYREDDALLAAIADAHGPRDDPKQVRRGPGLGRVSPEIPGYEALSEVQRGGQGVVYKATQRATRRVVALKVLSLGGFASVRQHQRFEREIDLAAGLRHPRIVTVFESGVSPSGDHYYAMEYIEGSSLDEYVRSQRKDQAANDPKALARTLRLFAKVCDAVHYAHQRGVIHRDLKPGNIRVDPEGEPHVLDFGLAKVSDPEQVSGGSLETLTGEFLGTLAYASPEQTKGDPSLIDVRTDVYSLGVILYEMLTGQLPYQVKGPMIDVLKSIAEAEPQPPSSWYRRTADRSTGGETASYKINNEIETIVLKALSKDKDRRYQSADALRADIEHYLVGEPIEAKRDSTWYVLQKTVRRHKAPFSAAAALLLLLTGFVSFVVVEKRAYAAERDEAQGFVEDVLRLIQFSDPLKGTGASKDMIAVLDSRARQLDENPPRHAEHEASMRNVIGHAYKEYRQFEKAQRELEIALELRREVFDPPSADLADTLSSLGDVYRRQDRLDDAEALLRESLAMREALFEPPHPALAQGLNTLAALLQLRGNFQDASAMYRKALEMRRTLKEQGRLEHPQLLAASLSNLAEYLAEKGQYQEAEGYYRDAMAELEALGLHEDVKMAWVMNNLGQCLTRQKQYEEANRLLDAAMAIKQARIGPSNPSVAWTLHYQSLLKYELGAFDESERLCREALAMRREAFPGGHRDTAASLGLLGRILIAQGNAGDAEQPLREALAVLQDHVGEEHHRTADARSGLGQCLAALGRLEEAERLLVDGFDRLVATLGPEHANTRRAKRRLVELYQAWNQPEKAERYQAMVDANPAP